MAPKPDGRAGERNESRSAEPDAPLDGRQWPLLPLSLGAGFSLTAQVLDRELAPVDGEPILVGWLRVAAGHPVRCAVGVALLALILSPIRRRLSP